MTQGRRYSQEMGQQTMTETGAEIALSDVIRNAVANATAGQIDVQGLLEGVDVVKGRPLVDKGSLVGEPFVITNMTFRKGNKDKSGTQHDYVSCEITTLSGTPVECVFNDGSTGIRRQAVAYLVAKGHIPTQYADAPDTALWGVLPGSDDKDPAFDVKLLAPRGLRVSEYTNEYTDEGVTYYLA